MELLRKTWSKSLALCAVLVFALASVASAAQDYSAVTDGAGSEIAAALPIALAVVGIFVGVMIAYKVLRRVVRA